jgi:folate-binding protein YgfZ
MLFIPILIKSLSGNFRGTFGELMTDLELNTSYRTEFYKSQYPNMQFDIQRNTINIFDSSHDEYKTLYAGVALRDISHYGLIELQGKEILDFLHRVSTNSLKDLQLNTTEFTLFTNEKGRIIERSTVLNFGDSILLVSSDYYKNKLFSWINKYIIMEDVKIYDVSGKYSIYELLGPQVESFATLIFDSDINGLENNHFKNYKVNNEDYFVLKYTKFDVSKYWIICKPLQGNELVRYMMEHKSVFDFKLVGEEAYEKFRIEKGIPTAPDEISDLYNPYEAGLIDEVSFTKGCYIGQEVIARLDTYDKVQKNLCGVIFNTDDKLSGKLFVHEGNREVGNITSITFSPSLKTNIALAYIKRESSESGKEVVVKSEEGFEYPVSISGLPIKK